MGIPLLSREGNTVVLTNTAKKPGKSDGEVNPPSKKPTDKTTNKTVNKITDKTSDKLPQTGQLGGRYLCFYLQVRSVCWWEEFYGIEKRREE